MANKSSANIYSLSTLRAVALHTQQLTAPLVPSPITTRDRIASLVEALGYVQIDTLSVVNRAHTVTLWARLGSYDLDDLDKLIYAAGERRLYEGWGHAACLIPLEHYRYHRWRTDSTYSYNPSFRDWLKKPVNRELVEQVLDRIRSDGALRVGDIPYDGPQREAWCDWKPSKTALEVLFAWGDLMIADRISFQRVYDVKERVLPGWVDITPVPDDVARRFCLEQAARALGVFDLRHLTFYAYMRARPVRSEVKALVEDGTLVEIRGESTKGIRTWRVHRDNVALLERAADGEIEARRTTFLSPFDSLFWAQNRDQVLWGFHQLLEAYKPAEDRVYGYLCHPILHGDRLVGRFDPKLDRESGRLVLKALHLEPGVEPDDRLVAEVAKALRDFLAWHGAQDLEIEKSDPAVFGEKLMRAI